MIIAYNSEYTQVGIVDDHKNRQFGFLKPLTVFLRKNGIYYMKTFMGDDEYNAIQLTDEGAGQGWEISSDEQVLPVHAEIKIIRGDYSDE